MGWVEVAGGWRGRVGSQRQVKPSIYKDTDSSAVSSVSDRKGLNPQHRLRQLFAALWHLSHPY